eukprot:354186-Chlamydomonas_euryale.AAC.7
MWQTKPCPHMGCDSYRASAGTAGRHHAVPYGSHPPAASCTASLSLCLRTAPDSVPMRLQETGSVLHELDKIGVGCGEWRVRQTVPPTLGG